MQAFRARSAQQAVSQNPRDKNIARPITHSNFTLDCVPPLGSREREGARDLVSDASDFFWLLRARRERPRRRAAEQRKELAALHS